MRGYAWLALAAALLVALCSKLSLTLITESATEDVLSQFWSSDRCQLFYPQGGAVSAPLPPLSRSSLPPLRVSEDLFAGGRERASRPYHHSNEVFVNHKYKFVYIGVRKAASSTVLRLLEQHFATTWYWCRDLPTFAGGPPQRLIEDPCHTYLDRCSSRCLDASMVAGYFFFSFVRHPVARFYSGFRQGLLPEVWAQREKLITNQSLIDILYSAVNDHDYVNEHLETQSLSLSTQWRHPDGTQYRVPLDFLGRVEHFRRDFKQALRLIAARSAHPLPPIPDSDMETRSNAGGEDSGFLLQMASPEVDALVRRAYAQDMACFGYQ
jgi:hypothetical protein